MEKITLKLELSKNAKNICCLMKRTSLERLSPQCKISQKHRYLITPYIDTLGNLLSDFLHLCLQLFYLKFSSSRLMMLRPSVDCAFILVLKISTKSLLFGHFSLSQ
jgi:hypothetical protein